MSYRTIVLAATLLAAISIAMFLQLRYGAIEIPLVDVWRHILADDGSNAALSLREIRLPRALNALFVGAALAMSGTLIQIIIRNPLGDPGLTGVSAGAALGVALIVTFVSRAGWAVVGGGVLGGLIAASMTFVLARASGMRDLSIILAGIAVSIFMLAMTSAIMILNRASMQTLYYWMIGGFANKGWVEFSHLWIWTATGGLGALLAARNIELLRMQDGVAQSLGLQTTLWRAIGGLLSVLLAAVAVSVAGPIGFVGFVAPHLVRRALSGQGQIALIALLPLAALTGGALTLLADLAARDLPLGNRAPAGVLVTLCGGIVFLIIARRLKGSHI